MDVSVSPPAKLRNFLGWAFFLSIALHLALLPLAGRAKAAPAATTPPRHSTFTITLPTPAPTPRATPPPSRATQRPRPVAAARPPRAIAKAPRVHPELSRPSRVSAYSPPLAGGKPGNGAPASTGDGGPDAALDAGPSPPPTPSPTPKPTCAKPHVDAAVTHAVEPEYPELAARQSVTGTTEVKVTLSESGAVLDARVYAGSGSAALDAAAIAAAEHSTYSPEIDDCVKRAGSYLFRAEFAAQ